MKIVLAMLGALTYIIFMDGGDKPALTKTEALMFKMFFFVLGMLFFVPVLQAQHDFVMRAAAAAAGNQPPAGAAAMIFPAAMAMSR